MKVLVIALCEELPVHVAAAVVVARDAGRRARRNAAGRPLLRQAPMSTPVEEGGRVCNAGGTSDPPHRRLEAKRSRESGPLPNGFQWVCAVPRWCFACFYLSTPVILMFSRYFVHDDLPGAFKLRNRYTSCFPRSVVSVEQCSQPLVYNFGSSAFEVLICFIHSLVSVATLE